MFSTFDVTLSTAQSQVVPMQAVNIMGQPTGQQGIPSASVVNTSVCSATVAADGSSVTVKAIAPGSATVLVNGTSLKGNAFSGSFTVLVTASDVATEAIGFEFDFSTPPVTPPAPPVVLDTK